MSSVAIVIRSGGFVFMNSWINSLIKRTSGSCLYVSFGREKSLRHVTMVIQEFCCHGNMTSHFSLLDWSKVDLSSLKWKAWIASQRARGVAWENSRHFATPSWLSMRNDLREKRRNSKPMPCYYPDLESASDWSGCAENLPQPRTTNSSSDASSVWNLCARFSDVIFRRNQWWRPAM